MSAVEWFPKPRRRKLYPASRYPWRVDYHLAYDGGDEVWTGWYRTRRRARVAIWWHVNVASWGGRAALRRREAS